MTRALILPLLWCCIGIAVAVWTIPAWGQQVSADLDGPCFGRILITNHQTGITDQNTLHDVDGIEVGVHYTSTPNWRPAPLSHDIIVVTVPEGFMAVPSDILLEEGGTVEVLICEALLG